MHSDMRGLILPNYPEALESPAVRRLLESKRIDYSPANLKELSKTSCSFSLASGPLKPSATQQGFPFPEYSGIALRGPRYSLQPISSSASASSLQPKPPTLPQKTQKPDAARDIVVFLL